MEELKKITEQAYSSDQEYNTIAEQLFYWAQKAYEEHEISLTKKNQSKERQWLFKMMEQGTASEKISAISQLVASQPKYPLKLVNTLLKKVQTTNKKLIADAVEAIKDTFITHLLPNRKMLGFKEALKICEISTLKANQVIALYTEHRLKDLYYNFVELL